MTGSAVIAATNLVIGILLARALSPDGFGRYAVMVSAVTIMAAVAEMRIGNAAIYFINNKGLDRQRVTTDSVRVAVVFGMLLLPLLWIALSFESYFGPLSVPMVLGISLLGFAKVLIATQLPLLVGKMEIGKYVTGLVMPNLVLMVLVTAGFVSSGLDFAFAVAVTLVAHLVGAAATSSFISRDYRREHKTTRDALSPLVKYGALINVSYVVMLLGSEGSLLLLNHLVKDFSDVGFYRIALRLSSVVMMAVGAVSPLLYAKFAATGSQARNEHVQRTCRVYWFFLVGWVIFLNLFGEPVLGAMYGDEYLSAAPILGFVVLGIAALGGSSPVFQMFYSNGAASWVSLVHGVNLSVLVGLMYWLVPEHGGLGAAISFAISNGVGLSVAYVLAHVRFGLKLLRCMVVTPDDLRFALQSLR